MKIKAEHIKLVLPWQNLRTSEVVRHKVKVISVVRSEKRQKSGGVQKLRIVENQGWGPERWCWLGILSMYYQSVFRENS